MLPNAAKARTAAEVLAALAREIERVGTLSAYQQTVQLGRMLDNSSPDAASAVLSRARGLAAHTAANQAGSQRALAALLGKSTSVVQRIIAGTSLI